MKMFSLSLVVLVFSLIVIRSPYACAQSGANSAGSPSTEVVLETRTLEVGAIYLYTLQSAEPVWIGIHSGISLQASMASCPAVEFAGKPMNICLRVNQINVPSARPKRGVIGLRVVNFAATKFHPVGGKIELEIENLARQSVDLRITRLSVK